MSLILKKPTMQQAEWIMDGLIVSVLFSVHFVSDISQKADL